MKKIGFIGLGLIGGSIARSIRRVHPDYTIYAYNRSKDSLAAALKDGIIDVVCEENDPRLGDCDYLFLCTPVEYNLQFLEAMKPALSKGCILTDVGSVKGDIHRRVEELGLGDIFIGGHPMAGSEKTGFENSTDRLLENAYYIITPGSGIGVDILTDFTELITSLGAIPLILTCEEHDYITAGVSHLPHIIASALVNLVRNLDTENGHMRMIAAGGFRDITRIASSSPVMWQQICQENRENISSVLDEYIRMLIQIRYEIDQDDGAFIYQMFESSRDYRDSIDVLTRGAIGRVYAIYVDLADEPGGIAAITALLATDQINIRNMGIIHNREFEQGVLKIEFYDADTCRRGLNLLQKRNYVVHEA